MARGEVIRVRDEFYIRSSSPRVDVRTRALKQGDTFAVFDRFGDIETFGSGELGLYYQDTRFLSRLSLKIGKDRPLLLSSFVREDNAVLAVDATNPDVSRDSEVTISRGTLHVFRSKFCGTKHVTSDFVSITTGGRRCDFSFQSSSMQILPTYSNCVARNAKSRPSLRARSDARTPWCSCTRGWTNAFAGRGIVFDPTPSRLSESLASFKFMWSPARMPIIGGQSHARWMAIRMSN